MKLSVISSNIRFDNPADGENAWPHRRALLSETLKKHSPHIIATQEGRFDQLKDFESLLNDFEIIDAHRSWIKERMYPTFFIKKNTFETIQSGDLWLSETPEVAGSLSFGSTFPRLMTWIKLQPKNSNINLLLINTHLDHKKSETRIEQIKVLSKEILKLKEERTKVLIFGDFNDSPQSVVRDTLLQNLNFLKDSWTAPEETSHHHFDGQCENGSRIDWIMVDKSFEVEKCFLDKNSIAGKYPSDHFPVVCEIKL